MTYDRWRADPGSALDQVAPAAGQGSEASTLGRDFFQDPEARAVLCQPCARRTVNGVVPADTGGAQLRDDGFPVEVIEGVPVVAAPQEIDITNAEALRSALLEAAANGPGTLVVDMTQTRFCDSSGLHALIAAHRRAEAEGREVLLVIPGTAVLRVFALTGMDRVIPSFTSLAQALAQTSRRTERARLRAGSRVPGAAADPDGQGVVRARSP